MRDGSAGGHGIPGNEHSVSCRAREGLTGFDGIRTAARVAAFPFTLAFLLAHAAWVHSRRALRLFAAR